MNCSACEAYLATESQDEGEKIRIAAIWSERYGSEIKPEDINCMGCRSESLRFAWCYKCPIRACVIAKGYQNCGDCPDLPCPTNLWLYESVPEVKENLGR